MTSAIFEKALEYCSDVIEQLTSDKLHDPTPCSEWDVRQLLNHMLYEVAWVPELLAGKTIDDVGDKLDGDLVGDDPVAAWEHYATMALAAVNRCDEDATVHLSYGDGPALRYVNEVGGDIVIHTWDLAKGLVIDFHIEDAVAEEIYNGSDYIMPMARQYGLVAEEIEVDGDASVEEKLLAKYGRSIEWEARK